LIDELGDGLPTLERAELLNQPGVERPDEVLLTQDHVAGVVDVVSQGVLLRIAAPALIAVSGNFGFIAPVLAAESPTTIDAISHYPPVVGLNAVAAVGFMVGFVLLGIAIAKTATLPRSAGILVAVGAPSHLIGFALAQFVSPSLWVIAVLGSVALGAGLALAGYRIWQRPASWLATMGTKVVNPRVALCEDRRSATTISREVLLDQIETDVGEEGSATLNWADLNGNAEKISILVSHPVSRTSMV
jgi:hypothetical protein